MAELTTIGNDLIIADGLNMVVCTPKYNEPLKAKITESMASAIYKTLTSFDVALAMKRNYNSIATNQTRVIAVDGTALDDLVSIVLDINKSVRIESTVLFVSSNIGAVTITGGLLLAMMNLLKDAGAEPDPTYGKYTNIKFVIEPPAVTVMEDGVVYVLLNDYKGFAANTCFMVTESEEGERGRGIFDPETGEVTPAAYGDPEDASSYPAADEGNIIEGPAGGADVDTVEVHSGVVESSVAVTAANNVNVVNVDMTDGQINATIA